MHTTYTYTYTHMHMHTYTHMHLHACYTYACVLYIHIYTYTYTYTYTCYTSLQAEAVTKPRTFADACAHSSAKHVTVCGRTGPVNAVEADGVLFIEDDETEAEAKATR